MSKDVKRMVAEIRQGLEAYPREQLQQILAFVFKEYVVEGATPVQGALSMLDARTELEGLSFAELMTWLQLHLDVPELALFEVANGRVSVRVGGRAVALESARAPEPLPAPTPPPAAPVRAGATVQSQPNVPPPQPMPATRVTPSTPASLPQPMPPPAAPPSSSPSTSVPATSTPPASTPSTTQPPNPAGGEQKDDPSSPSSRFSWLEVD